MFENALPNGMVNRTAAVGRLGLSMRLAACFFAVTSATVFIGLAPEANLIWIANGLLLAYLLLAPRRRWPFYLCVGFAAQCVGAMLVDPHRPISFLFVALNMVEVMIGALLLRRRTRELPRFGDRSYVLRFVAYAVVAGPVATGLIYALILMWLRHADPVMSVCRWASTDGLGTAVTTPAYVALFQARSKFIGWRRQWLTLALPVVVSVALFSQSRAPLVFLLYPILLLVMLRLGLGWAALSTLFMAGAGTWFTLHGQGAFAAYRAISPMEPAILLQAFVAGAMFMLYSVSVVMGSQSTARKQLEKIASLHSLVTENSRDAILIADFDGRPSYVSPAMQQITGWTPEEMIDLGVSGMVHGEDRMRVRKMLTDLRAGTGSGVAEYRLRGSNGQAIWVEASLRVFVDPATRTAAGTMSIVRDISERKRAEQQMQEAYHAVEALAVVDSLTGLGNRRRFDECLTTEWRRALREAKPLSLLLIDADYFKAFNDNYGHVSGDNCLKQIAEAALEVVSRPGDLVARYGGEEFAVLLPDTDGLGANEIANEICEALRKRNVAHRSNPHRIVTVSVGTATVVPSLGESIGALIEMADQALYRAKRTGRNRVCATRAIGEAGSGAVAITESTTRKMA